MSVIGASFDGLIGFVGSRLTITEATTIVTSDWISVWVRGKGLW